MFKTTRTTTKTVKTVFMLFGCIFGELSDRRESLIVWFFQKYRSMTTMSNLLEGQFQLYTKELFLRTRLFRKMRTSLEGDMFPLTEAMLSETKVYRRCFLKDFCSLWKTGLESLSILLCSNSDIKF